MFIKKSVPQDQRDTLAKVLTLAISMNQELNQTPGGIGYNLPTGVNQGNYNQLLGIPSSLPIGAPTMNPMPIYAPQPQASQQFTAQASTWKNGTNNVPTQIQYASQPQTRNQQFDNMHPTNQVPTTASENQGSHISAEVEALKKMISQVTLDLSQLKMNPLGGYNQSQPYNNQQNYNNQNQNQRYNNKPYNRQWNMGLNNGGVNHDHPNARDNPNHAQSVNLADMNLLTNWCRLHDTASHSKVNCAQSERIIRIAQADSQPKDCSNDELDKVNTAMLVDTFLCKEFQAEVDGEPCVYDAQAFQTKNNYNLRSQGKALLTEPPPPIGGFVPLDANASNNPHPPQDFQGTCPKQVQGQDYVLKGSFDVTKEMERTATTMSLMEVLRYCPE